MKTHELMSKNPRTCPSSATLNDAAQIMSEADCGIVPVVDHTDGVERLVGVVTDRDICIAAYTKGQMLKELSVGEFMSQHPRTCSPDSSIVDAQATMRGAKVRRLPVVDENGAVVGLLSLADIAWEAERERLDRNPKVSKAAVGSLLGAIVESRSRHTA